MFRQVRLVPIGPAVRTACRVKRTPARRSLHSPAGAMAGYKGFGSFHSDNVEQLLQLSDEEFAERVHPYPQAIAAVLSEPFFGTGVWLQLLSLVTHGL